LTSTFIELGYAYCSEALPGLSAHLPRKHRSNLARLRYSGVAIQNEKSESLLALGRKAVPRG
jgi:hypothetical protein